MGNKIKAVHGDRLQTCPICEGNLNNISYYQQLDHIQFCKKMVIIRDKAKKTSGNVGS